MKHLPDLFFLFTLQILFLAFTTQVWSIPFSSENINFTKLGIGNASLISSEVTATQYLNELERNYSQACNEQEVIRWNYATNVTKENEEASVKALDKFYAFQATVQKYINTNFPDWKQFSSDELKREFQFLTIRGPASMDPSHLTMMNSIGTKMESAYAAAKVCEYGSKDPSTCKKLSLEPDLEEKLKTVKDYNELAYYWTAWHDKLSSEVSTATYKKFIDLQNELARANNYADMGDFWGAPYDDGTPGWTVTSFEEEMLSVWEQLRPYYNKLHAYVRMKLRKNPSYADKIKKFGTLPANLMGNMWAQDWTALDASTKPFPNAPSLDATQAMKKSGYTILKMFQASNDFFKGLGLLEMTDTFWEKSLIEKPTDREVVCHASAHDLCLGKGNTDFRIKMCTNVDQDDLITVHHEMGHIEYFMQYTNQRIIFRDGANPGFHEAIGDSLALSVTTPKHLQCRLKLDLGLHGLCDENSNQTSNASVTETDINFLYIMALQKFAFFPFAISMDSWRWGVFNGSIPETEYNKKWWEIRKKNQGISPPSPRTGTTGLDAAAKYHIVANVEYIRYFISFILQFQFYEAMCIEAKEYNPNDVNSRPLYQCDFAGSKEAGKRFGDMMKLGFEKPWPVALKVLTGNEKMDTKSLLNYFRPLFELFDRELAANGEKPGFGTATVFEEKVADVSLNINYENVNTKFVTWTAHKGGTENEDDSSVAEIVVGGILAGSVAAIIVCYFGCKKCTQQKNV